MMYFLTFPIEDKNCHGAVIDKEMESNGMLALYRMILRNWKKYGLICMDSMLINNLPKGIIKKW